MVIEAKKQIFGMTLAVKELTVGSKPHPYHQDLRLSKEIKYIGNYYISLRVSDTNKLEVHGVDETLKKPKNRPPYPPNVETLAHLQALSEFYETLECAAIDITVPGPFIFRTKIKWYDDSLPRKNYLIPRLRDALGKFRNRAKVSQ